MPRPPTKPDWKARVREIVEEQPKKTPVDIYQLLVKESTEQGRTDYPSVRTIRRIREEHVDPANAAERKQFSGFRWPESMVPAGIPWEASAAILEYLRAQHAFSGNRPTVAATRWFWRVSCAAPGAPLIERARIAQYVTAAEFAELEWPRRRAEWEILCRTWTNEGKAAYEAARLNDPTIPPLAGWGKPGEKFETGDLMPCLFGALGSAEQTADDFGADRQDWPNRSTDIVSPLLVEISEEAQ